jgi:hypothetical protein
MDSDGLVIINQPVNIKDQPGKDSLSQPQQDRQRRNEPKGHGITVTPLKQVEGA